MFWVKTKNDDLQIIAFCYDCARVRMSNRRRRPRAASIAPATHQTREGDRVT
jgi:hypothetical protein